MTQPSNPQTWQQAAFAVRDGVVAAAARMDSLEVTRSSGGVSVTLSASGALRAVRIDRQMANDLAGVERQLMLAHQEAAAAIRQVAEDVLAPLRGLTAQVTPRA